MMPAITSSSPIIHWKQYKYSFSGEGGQRRLHLCILALQRALQNSSPQGHQPGKTAALSSTGACLGNSDSQSLCDHTLRAALASPKWTCSWLAVLFILPVLTHTSAHGVLPTSTEPQWAGWEGTPQVISFHTSSVCLLLNWPRLRS